MNVHDAFAVQRLHPVAEVLTHAANLPVEPLGKDDAKPPLAFLLDFTALGNRIENRYARTHLTQKIARYGLVYRHDVLLLVAVLHAQNPVDDIAVVGKQNKAGAGLVEPADGENALGVTHKIDDVGRIASVGGTGNAHRLVQGEVDRFRLVAKWAVVECHGIARFHAVALAGDPAVDLYPPGVDPGIGLAARANAGLAEVFVEGGRHGAKVRCGVYLYRYYRSILKVKYRLPRMKSQPNSVGRVS